jgi:hypothetical protein
VRNVINELSWCREWWSSNRIFVATIVTLRVVVRATLSHSHDGLLRALAEGQR